MLPICRTEGDGFSIPTFDVAPSDVEGLMDALQEFQSAFHDCFARSEPRVHFFDYMVGQFSKLERKPIEPMALQVAGGTIRGMQRFISDVLWDEEQMLWNYHQLVAEEMGDPEGVLIFDETSFVKKGRTPWGWRGSTVAPWGRWRIVRSGCSLAMPRAMAMPLWTNDCSYLRHGGPTRMPADGPSATSLTR